MSAHALTTRDAGVSPAVVYVVFVLCVAFVNYEKYVNYENNKTT